jgi:hypothetical protein
VERMTWLTEERIAASATGAPTFGCTAAVVTAATDLQIQKQRGSVPAAYGPGLVGGSTSVNLHTNDHVAMGRTAWDATPLGSLGVGYG